MIQNRSYLQRHSPHHLPHQEVGFTLIELVLVLLLLAILGAIAVPRLQLSSQFEERLQADKLVGLLRQAQLRAMNDPQSVTENSDISRCAKLVISSTAFSVARNCKSGLLDNDVIKQQASQGNFVGVENINISINGGNNNGVSLPVMLQFGEPAADQDFLSENSFLGRPVINGAQLDSTFTIIIGGKAVNIEPEGYIHAP